MAIRVILADDHRMLRDALTIVLNRESDIEVIGVASEGHTAVALARAFTPDVLVLDVAMPAINGIEITKSVRMELPGIQILALSAYADNLLVQDTLKAGAAGYVSKLAPVTELVSAIRVVASGQSYLSQEVTSRMADQFRSDAGQVGTVAAALSPRERQVLRLVARGDRTNTIAKSLGISEGTVEAHRRNLMRKLNLRTVAELTKYAVRVGLTSL